MIKKIIHLRNTMTDEELIAINTHEWELVTSADGHVTRVLKNRGWSYKDSYQSINRSLAQLFDQLHEAYIGEKINGLIVLGIEERW